MSSNSSSRPGLICIGLEHGFGFGHPVLRVQPAGTLRDGKNHEEEKAARVVSPKANISLHPCGPANQ